jgi:hypothetical protein
MTTKQGIGITKEYLLYYGNKVVSEKENQQQRYYESHFKDETLNRWTKNARQQAESFAKMAVNDFAKLLVRMAKETGLQLGNSIVVMIGALLLFSGVICMLWFFSEYDASNLILGIVLILMGFCLYQIANKNFENHNI